MRLADSAPKQATHTILPSDLLLAWKNGIRPDDSVAVDTETSGLYIDDGARISTVSLAFKISDGWRKFLAVPEGDIQNYWNGGIWSITTAPVYVDGGEETFVSFAWPIDQGVSNTGKPEDDGYATMWPDADNLSESEWRSLLEWLRLVGEDQGHTYHHAKFDLHMFDNGVRRWPGVAIDLHRFAKYDTQNGCSLLYPTDVLVPRMVDGRMKEAPTTSLKPVSAHLWGEHETDEQAVIKKYLAKHKLPSGRWDLMPWDIIAKYAEEDAIKTARLRLRQIDDVRRGIKGQWLTGTGGVMDPVEALQRRMDTSLMLFRVERRGLPFAVAEALEVSSRLQDKEQFLIEELPFDRPTLPAAKDYWFTDKGLDLAPYSTTDKGAPQINEAIINKMVKANIPGAATWRDLQKVRTADERWYRGYASMAGSDGRLRASVRQNGTVSGRFSVERIQLQAIPHNYRLSAFDVLDGIPTPRTLIGDGVPEGWGLWELDLAQAELRVAALFADCKPMLKLIHEGADLHAVTAKELFNIDEDDPLWGKMRTIAKRSNFGLIFGSGWETFQADLEKQTGIVLTDSEAQRIVKGWNALYPEFKRAIYRHQSVVERRMRTADYGRGVGWIQMANGERRWWVPGEDTHKAFNQRVQPSLAQYGIDWWLESERLLMEAYGDDPLYDENGWIGRVGMTMMIHDSQVPLIKRGDEHLLDQIVKIGTDLWEERFPGLPGGVDVKEWGKG